MVLIGGFAAQDAQGSVEIKAEAPLPLSRLGRFQSKRHFPNQLNDAHNYVKVRIFGGNPELADVHSSPRRRASVHIGLSGAGKIPKPV